MLITFILTGCASNLQIANITQEIEVNIKKNLAKNIAQNIDLNGTVRTDKVEKEKVFNAFFKKNKNLSKWNIDNQLPLYIVSNKRSLSIESFLNNKYPLKRIHYIETKIIDKITNNMYLPKHKMNLLINDIKEELKIPNNSMMLTIKYETNANKVSLYGIKSVDSDNLQQNSYFYKLTLADNKQSSYADLILLATKLSIPAYEVIRRDNKLLNKPPYLRYITNEEDIKSGQVYKHDLYSKIDNLKYKIKMASKEKIILSKSEGFLSGSNDAIFLPGDKQILACGFYKGLLHFDLETGNSKIIPSKNKGCMSIKLYDKGKKAVTGSLHGGIEFFDLENNTSSVKYINASVVDLINVKRYKIRVNQIDISDDEKYLAISAYYGIVLVIDLETHEKIRVTKIAKNDINSVVFINSKYKFIAGSEECITLFSLDKVLKEIYATYERKVYLRTHSLANYNNILAVGTHDKITLFDTNTFKTTGMLEYDGMNTVFGIDVSQDGKYLVSGDWSENVIYWDLKTKKIIKILKGHDALVNSVAFNRDGSSIVSTSSDEIILWNIKKTKNDNIDISKLKNLEEKSVDNTILYQYIFTQPIALKDLNIFEQLGYYKGSNNKLTFKEIKRLSSLLNYDFADPIITSIFTDSYQYYIGASTKVNNYTWEVDVKKQYTLDKVYFTSKYNLANEGYKLIFENNSINTEQDKYDIYEKKY